MALKEMLNGREGLLNGFFKNLKIGFKDVKDGFANSTNASKIFADSSAKGIGGVIGQLAGLIASHLLLTGVILGVAAVVAIVAVAFKKWNENSPGE